MQEEAALAENQSQVDVAELVKLLSAKGVTFLVNGDRLGVHPASQVSADDWNSIRLYKHQIISTFQEKGTNGTNGKTARLDEQPVALADASATSPCPPGSLSAEVLALAQQAQAIQQTLRFELLAELTNRYHAEGDTQMLEYALASGRRMLHDLRVSAGTKRRP